ncbi:ABC transporter ATP-binding protein, partial [Carnobacterium maltaromaticum]
MSIYLNNLQKKNKNIVLFNSLNFNIPNGLYRLVGKNGVGKSTLLKLISGLDTSYTGKIVISGKRCLYLDSYPIGISPFSIKENLEILFTTFSIVPNIIQWEKLESFFSGTLNTPYGKASLGTKMKLGLSLLFFDIWDVILIDETFSPIDTDSLQLIAEDLCIKSKKNDLSIIYV